MNKKAVKISCVLAACVAVSAVVAFVINKIYWSRTEAELRELAELDDEDYFEED